MTLQEVKQLHAFNSWANNKIFDALAKLSTEQYMRDMQASHGSIHGTLLHMVGAERIWISRLLGAPEPDLLTVTEAPTLQAARSIWETNGYETARFLLASLAAHRRSFDVPPRPDHHHDAPAWHRAANNRSHHVLPRNGKTVIQP